MHDTGLRGGVPFKPGLPVEGRTPQSAV